jgi:hypothetical protein
MNKEDREQVLQTYNWDDLPVERIEHALKVTETGAMMQFDRESKFAEALRQLLAERTEMLKAISTAI